ncbi:MULTISPECIES: 2-thiouracil desulfurase family protein [Methanothrix]|uniref:2-thiouracil desulfurase family protein n=1 Tax=Methanothrix TaxID=2222 RepID=UPI002A347D44|nr:DUF523 domain-containing protein [Candidatus Omnitrophota bacterium]
MQTRLVEHKPKALISLCACGVPCRYHGQTHKMGHRLYKEKTVQELKEKYELVPICPEQLGGLPVPRCPCAVTWEGDVPHVVERGTGKGEYRGRNLTEAYLEGAKWAVWMAEVFGAERAFMLKQSPACDPSNGIASRALRKAGLYVKGL